MLVGTEDVTAKVAAALEGVAPEGVVEARRGALTKLEQACEEGSKKAKGGPLKCERVSLYQGGQHWLYKYRRYEDVRLVFAPERDIAAFGGDPDNFQFPRWCLDMSILRAYEGGKPAKTPNHLRFDWDGAQPGDAVFVSGHPGNTDRLLTAAQLEVQRDTFMPFWLMRFSELRGRMIQYSKTGEEARRTAESYLNTDRELDQGAAQAVRRAARPGADRERTAKEAALRARSRSRARGPPAPGTRSRRRRPPGATSSSRTPSSRAARRSTASCSCTRARWCARPPSAPRRTSRGCRNSPRRACRPSCRA